MDISQLKPILELAREFGVVKMKVGELELEFGPIASPIANQVQMPSQEIPPEDLLYWSVDGQVPNFESKPEEPK